MTIRLFWSRFHALGVSGSLMWYVSCTLCDNISQSKLLVVHLTFSCGLRLPQEHPIQRCVFDHRCVILPCYSYVLFLDAGSLVCAVPYGLQLVNSPWAQSYVIRYYRYTALLNVVDAWNVPILKQIFWASKPRNIVDRVPTRAIEAKNSEMDKKALAKNIQKAKDKL